MDKQFKVGSVYRDVSGRVTKVVGPFMGRWRHDGHAWVHTRDDGRWKPDGFRSLIDGTDYYELKVDGHSYRHLLPGELHCVNGEWVPMEEPDAAGLLHGRAHDEEEVKPCTRSRAHIAAAPEPLRSPLDWNKRTEFDPFPGFHVSSRGAFKYEEDVMLAPRHKLQGSPDLHTAAHQVAPMFGSAFLSGD